MLSFIVMAVNKNTDGLSVCSEEMDKKDAENVAFKWNQEDSVCYFIAIPTCEAHVTTLP